MLCNSMIKPFVNEHDFILPDTSNVCDQETKVATMLLLMAYIPEMGLPSDHTGHINEHITEYADMMKMNTWQSIRHARTFGMFARGKSDVYGLNLFGDTCANQGWSSCGIRKEAWAWHMFWAQGTRTKGKPPCIP